MATVIVSRTQVQNWYRSRQATRWVILIDGKPAWVHTTGVWDEALQYAAFVERDGEWEFNGSYVNTYDILRASPGRLLRTGKTAAVLMVHLYPAAALPVEVEPLKKET